MLETLISLNDSLVLIIDLKSAKLKDLSNKHANAVFKLLVDQTQRFYPNLLDKCYIVNTPIYFPDYWES